MRAAPTALFALGILVRSAAANGDYEIQVYPGRTTDKGSTFMEWHSNTAARGPRDPGGGAVQPDVGAYHETLEFTRGFTDWFETGFYVFSSARSGEGWRWVGDHVRPRVAVPAAWGWPVGVSLSAEAGYLRPRFAESRWDLELRPIVDCKRGGLYVSVNPAFERTLAPYADGSRSFAFAPAVKVSYDAFALASLGLEYYGNTGPVERAAPAREQTHALFPTADLHVGDAWEVNLAVGFGLTRATDSVVVKTILGRRF